MLTIYIKGDFQLLTKLHLLLCRVVLSESMPIGQGSSCRSFRDCLFLEISGGTNFHEVMTFISITVMAFTRYSAISINEISLR